MVQVLWELGIGGKQARFTRGQELGGVAVLGKKAVLASLREKHSSEREE